MFATHGAGPDSAHAGRALQGAQNLVTASRVWGVFNCQGEVKAEFLEKAQKKNPPPPWIKDAPAAAGHPDASDIAGFQKELARAVGKLEGQI